MIKDGLVQDPSGFSSALWNVTQRAEGFLRERNDAIRGIDSWGRSSFDFGDSSAAKMVAAGSGQMGKLALFASNAQGAMGATTQGPALPYDPIGEFMRMQVATPNFGSVASAQQSSASSAAASSGSPSFSVDGGGSSSKEATEMTKSKAEEFSKALQNQKGYSKDDADALVKMMSEKAKDDVGDTKKLVDSIPNRGDGDWHKKFAQWYGTKIGGKDAKEVAEGIEKDVYGKDDEIKLKRLKAEDVYDPKDTKKKGNPTMMAYTVEGDHDGISVTIYYDGSRWFTKDEEDYTELSAMEGASGTPSTADGTPSTLKLKPDYRDGVEDMKVGKFMDYLDEKFGITRPGKKADPAVAASGPGQGASASPAKMSDKDVKALQDIIDGKDSAIPGFATVSAIEGQENDCQIEILEAKKDEFKKGAESTATEVTTKVVEPFKDVLATLPAGGKIVLKFGSETVEIPKNATEEKVLAKLKEAVAG